MNRTVSFLRGLGALTATAVLLVGLPVALAQLVGWPLPTSLPTADGIREAIERGTVPVEVIINVLAAIAWLLWAQLAYAFVVEIAAAIRGRASRRIRLTMPGVQLLAGRLVASGAVMVSLAMPVGRSAAAVPLAPIAERVDAAPAAAAKANVSGSPAVVVRLPDLSVVAGAPMPADGDAPEIYETKPGDSWWAIGEMAFGDGFRWREVRDANIGRVMPDGTHITETTEFLYPGWDLRLPDSAVAPLRSAPGAEHRSTALPATVTVRQGDNLWDIAERTLQEAWGRQPAEDEIVSYWTALVDAARPFLADPGHPELIYRDQVFQRPAPSPEASAPGAPQGPVEVTVEAGDSLSEIAAETLGDPDRYPELFERNKERPQPDGGRLSDPDLLRPGWQISVADVPVDPPAAPSSGGLSAGARSTPTVPGRSGEMRTEPPSANGGAPTLPAGPEADSATPLAPPAGPGAAAPPVAGPGAPAPPRAGRSAPAPQTAAPPLTRPRTGPAMPVPPSAGETAPMRPARPDAVPPPAVEGSEPHADASRPAEVIASRVSAASELVGDDERTELDEEDDDIVRQLVWPGAGVLAAGVVLALDHRRRRQQRRRQPGERLPVPSESLRETERILRGGADHESARFVDATIRRLAVMLAGLDDAPPINGAELARDGELTVVFSDRCHLPPPFRPTSDRRRWVLQRPDDLDRLAPVEPVVAPVPTLVTVATNAQGSRVLLNLEQLGLTAVVGDPAAARDLVTTIALELAHSPWSDALTVYAVGLDARFATFDRVTWAPRLADVIDELSALDRTVIDLTESSAYASTFDARLHHAVADTWNAALVVCVADAEADRDDLARLAELAAGPGLVCGVVAGSDVGATCRLAVSADGVIIEPVGWEYSISNRIPAEQVGEMLDLVDLAGADPEPAPAHPPRGGDDHRAQVIETEFQPFSLDPPEAAEVAILGPIEVSGSAHPIRWPQSLAEIVYLALHREGVSDKHVMEALWPGQPPNGQRLNKYTSQARKNLGDGPNGAPLVPYITSGRYRLSGHVSCDYDRFTAAVRHARQHPRQARQALGAALELVRGVPFTTNRPDFYEWTHVEGLFYAVVDEVIDAAHQLAVLAIEAGDGTQARWAAQTGLKASPISEILWRDLMRIHAAAGDLTGVQRTWTELCRALDEDDPDDYLHPETVELYQQLTRKVRPGRR